MEDEEKTTSGTKKNSRNEKGFYEPYATFSRTLRTWLVAYGIGAPVLFASQDAFSPILENPGKAMPIVYMFLGGVIVQIIATLIYKYSMGYIYFKEKKIISENTKRFKVANWFSEAMWLELLFDVVSITLFTVATVKILQLYVKNG